MRTAGPPFQQALREFFKDKIAEMCEFCQARYETNPLRILDCKVPHDVEARAGRTQRPWSIYAMTAARTSTAYARIWTRCGIPYEVDPTIVRGLDYYTRTAFEVVHSGLGAKDVLMGGGRYDRLVEESRRTARPRGSGSGRASSGCCSCSGSRPQIAELDLVRRGRVPRGARPGACKLEVALRRVGLTAELDYSWRALKTQMREAARFGVRG